MVEQVYDALAPKQREEGVVEMIEHLSLSSEKLEKECARATQSGLSGTSGSVCLAISNLRTALRPGWGVAATRSLTAAGTRRCSRSFLGFQTASAGC